jgi:P27 family predicted phage terminase small subunit
MGRKAKPMHLKLLEGNRSHGPKRIEPEPPAGMPEAPLHLDSYAKEEWDKISTGLHSMGILSLIDQTSLAAYCSAYSRWRTAEEEIQKRVTKGGPLAGLVDITKSGNVIQNCLVGISNKAATDMVRYASEFGMTPSARARLAVDAGSGKKSKFEGLIGAKK